jgi:hypothetical protein
MLQHLQDNYSVLGPKALESNCTALSDPWNPDEPLENVWKQIFEVQRIATSGGAPITDISTILLSVAAITLNLAMFKKSGLLLTTTQQWHICRTFATFKSNFTLVASQH